MPLLYRYKYPRLQIKCVFAIWNSRFYLQAITAVCLAEHERLVKVGRYREEIQG